MTTPNSYCFKDWRMILIMKEDLKRRILEEIGLRKGDNVLHIIKKNTMLSSLIVETIGIEGKVYVFNALRNGKNKDPVKFYKTMSEINPDPESLDLILIEDSFFDIENKVESLKGLRKFLTNKGKVAVIENKDSKILKFFGFDKRKKIDEVMFDSSYRLKNEFNFTNKYYLLVFERE